MTLQIAGLGSPTGGARGNLHLEGRTLAQRRLDPNATAMHLDDLLGNGEPQAGAALGLGVGAVDLVELLEDARLVLLRNAGSGVGHMDGEVAVASGSGDAYLPGVRELDGIADKVEQDLGEALLVAHANRQALGNLGLEP